MFIKMFVKFYCVLLVNMFLVADITLGEKTQESLVMVYYPDDQIFALSDSTTVKNTKFPENSKIIDLCPISSEPSLVKFLGVENIWDPNADMISPSEPKCHDHFKLMIRKKPRYNYLVGFYVILDFPLLEQHGIAKAYNFSTVGDYVNIEDLFWFDVFRFMFADDKLWNAKTQHRIINHQRNGTQRDPIVCKNLESEIDNGLRIPGVEMKKFVHLYDEKYQRNMMKRFIWPESIKQKAGEEYFVRHQMVPIDDFTDKYSRLSTCTYLNTMPLWKSVSEGRMKRVEEYIQKVAEILPRNTLLIETIPIDILKMDEQPFLGSVKSTQIHLDPKHQLIPVPRFVIKLILYRPPSSNGGKTSERGFFSENDEYHMAIVIRNELGNEFEDPCGSDVGENACASHGWFLDRGVNYEGVYCCEFHEKFFKDRFHYSINMNSRTLLNLKNVLMRKGEGGTEDVFENITDLILKKKPNHEDDLIIRV